MEGIANQWIEAGHAEVAVTLRAVPPKNLSGGPDEWSGAPVNWSKTWLAEVGTDGWFSLSIATPETDDTVPSNTFFEVRPSLSRRGPIDTDASSSEDRTVVLTPTRFLHDTILPQVNSLMALDAGRETPSDGHVSMYGKDVALRLRLSDPEGLASQLEVWTWLERIHDTNGNGVMEQGEYRQQTISLNRGVSEMEVDLPLLSSLSVVPDSKNTGKISVVLVGEDLAGNALEGGGWFGEDHDLATISVQRRADTMVDPESISLDRINGKLLTGHEHHFDVALGDANGIASLDSLQLALIGESNQSACFIHYEPVRTGHLRRAMFCCASDGRGVQTTVGLHLRRPIFLPFELESERALFVNGGVPSLKVFDEGQDLGLGLYQLNSLAWVLSDDVDLRWLNISDTEAPYGQNADSTYWFHRNEIVHHQFALYHRTPKFLLVISLKSGSLNGR